MYRSFIVLLAILIPSLVSCSRTEQDAARATPTNVPAEPPARAAVDAGPGVTERRTDTGYIPPWNFMSLSTSGADTFLLRHPTYDGRGVVILVFDTGVDMSIPGLERTSTGERKVIDAIDFSRSNVIAFKRAKLAGTGESVTIGADGMPRLRGVAGLNPPPADRDEIYLGVMDEANYRNSSVRDFDGDGEAATKFGTVLYRAADGWRVAIDTDHDSSLNGEKGIGNYRDGYETLMLKQTGGGKAPLTFAASIDPAAKEVSFHYDMGGHGTHVAGIASGFGVNREPGFNGVAPGAQVISGKFSGDTAKDNTVTGSMRRAYEFAGRLADSLERVHRPVVVNMSFGIGSAQEGRSDMERFLDSLLPNHPNLYVVTSAGNEGPGLSTVGLPAAASRAITVGAALPRGIGRDGYTAALSHDIIWDFSSRGGEVDKPDIVAPGTAVSTIPRYAFQSRESGTSMASPYTAGVVALLLSALRQEDSTWVPTQELMRRALRYSAAPLAGYHEIEQGGGMLNVARAYELLRSYKRSGFARDLELYTISTFSPNYTEGRGSTAFWRSAYVPQQDWRQAFTIARYVPRIRKNAETDFFRAYTLEATAPWLKPVQSTVYIRNREPATVDVLYDREKMREPGLYTARIIARRADGRAATPDAEREFELRNTVIVPYTFSPEHDFTVTTPTAKLEAGMSNRYYFTAPAGAAAVTFTLTVPKGSRTAVSGKIADQRGITENYLPHVKGTERSEGSNTVTVDAMGKGVVEVVVQADAFDGAGEPAEYTLSAKCLMLAVMPQVERIGTGTQLNVEVTNTGVDPLRGDFTYTVKGYGRTIRDTMRSDFYSIPLVMRKDDGALWVRPTFSDEDYMRATDILLQIVDAEGNVQAEQALNTPGEWIFLPNFNREADSTKLWLRITFGTTNYERFLPVPVTVVENHMRPSDPRPLSGYSAGEIYPSIERTFSTKMSGLIDAPRGYHQIGEIGFKPRGSEQSIPFEFTFQ